MSAPNPLSATIPASYGLALLTLMRERGHADEVILRNCQLDRARMQDQNVQIDAWQYALMLHNAIKLDDTGGLAYELGLRSQVTKHGFVGFGLISCATLREAITFSERYFQARVSVFKADVAIKHGEVVIELNETVPFGGMRAFFMDLAVVELCSLFAKVLGIDPTTSGWTSQIYVPYAEPPAYARYKHRLPRFHFNQPSVQIRFPAQMMDEPIATADAVSVQLAIERCEQEIASKAASQTLAEQVVKRLVCQQGRYPDIAGMAQQLLLSERTLKRRLQDEDTSFQALLDQVRHRDSLRLLANPALAIKQVAEAVGYADPANFARAFGKWTGFSPREWRQQHQPQSNPHQASGPN
jgi:AraC-like DNA-binding protein